MFNKLLHRVELALSDAVKVFLQLHFEMLILALSLQRDGEVVWLWGGGEKADVYLFIKQTKTMLMHLTGFATDR